MAFILDAVRHGETYSLYRLIQKHLRDEVDNKPVMEVPLSLSDEIHVSRFGAIPKKRQPGKWRLIVDLSFQREVSTTTSIHCYVPCHMHW